jgi:DNA-binding NarL/FixJ family response regulator
VLVVDDNKRVLAGIERSVRRRSFLPLSYSSFASASAHIRDERSPMTAALIDVGLGRDGDGLEVIHQLRRKFGESVYCALMSGYPADPEMVAFAARMGALFLAKPIGSDRLATFLSQAVTKSLLPHPTLQGAVLGFVHDHQLSPQETRVIAKLATGTRRGELAEALSLSPDTLKCQVRGILTKASLPTTDHVISDVLRRASQTS